MALGGIKVNNRKEFDRDLKAFGDVTVPKELQRVMQVASATALRSLVRRTPVGNPGLWAPSSLPPPEGYKPGMARGGWQVAINRTTTDETKRIDPEGSRTVSSGLAVIKTAKPFDVVFIYNNVPYITELENGSSTQAPAGMVKLTIAQLATLRF
jgi:hypothetical protein